MRIGAPFIAIILVSAASIVPTGLNQYRPEDSAPFQSSSSRWPVAETVSAKPTDWQSEQIRPAIDPQDDILGAIMPAVVRISSRYDTGSGVIIDPDGIVLTNAHVVGQQDMVMITINGNTPKIGEVFRRDEIRDLALIRLPDGVYEHVRFVNEEEPLLGSPVYAIGYPLDLPGPATVTSGIVSRIIDVTKTERRLIQTDAPINSGNSGGPLLNASGEIIGIVTSTIFQYDSQQVRGLSFAVSATTIKDSFHLPQTSEGAIAVTPAANEPFHPNDEYIYDEMGDTVVP